MAYTISGSLGDLTEVLIKPVTTAESYNAGGFFNDDATILVIPTLYGNQGQAGQGTHPDLNQGLDFYTYSGGSWSFLVNCRSLSESFGVALIGIPSFTIPSGSVKKM